MVEMILSIISGGCMIGLGVYNLIIWKLIKRNASVIKATLVGRFHVRRGNIYGQQGCVIEYSVDNREYRREVIVTKETPLYNRNYWKRK